jgi:PAS domain S-box-containing protein
MPLMLVGLNHAGVVTQWNTGAEKITGLPDDQIIGKVLWEGYPIIPVTKEEVNRASASGETIHLSRSQRGQLHFDIVIYPIKNTLETGVVLLIDDVTKQVQSMNQLIQRDKLSSMGELASSMAQDINMPLQHIIQNIELASAALTNTAPTSIDNTPEPTLADALLKPLDIARQEGYRAAAITSNLVDFASSHRQIAKPHDIVEVLEHAVDLAATIYASTGVLPFADIHIERHYEQDLPLVPCNSSELQQVFLSLLRHCCYALADKIGLEHTNSVKKPELIPEPLALDEAANSADASADAAAWTPKITLTILESYEVLWIKIQHNGTGLTSAEQQMIFEPFFSNTLEQNGVEDTSGLEADRRQSFSHFIITDQHKGQMAVTSDLGVGTTFHMELCLK